MKQSPLDMFLDRMDASERADQLAFLRIMDAIGTEAVEEIMSRVQRVSCAAGLKRLVVEFAYYHPDAAWGPVVERICRHEKDLEIFESGVRALGRMCTEDSLAALRSLALGRATPEFRELVDRVLHESDPGEAFRHHFARLLQGSAQPTDANEGAHRLAGLLSADSLDPLRMAVQSPDPLIFRHALRLIGLIPSEEAGAFLLGFLQDTHREALEDRDVRADLTAMRTLPRPEVLGRCLQALVELHPEAAEALASGDPGQVQVGLEALQASTGGLREGFLLSTALAAGAEKAATLARHLAQAGEEAQQRSRRLEFGVDAAAQGLAQLVAQGLQPADPVIAVLADSLRSHTGRSGVAAALAQLVSPDDKDRLDLLIGESDGALRSAALEALGARRDPDLRPALHRLRRDSLVELAQRCLWHLGQLPDPEGTARQFLSQADPEEVQVGTRFVAVNGLVSLVPELLDVVGREAREPVQMAALQAVATLQAPASVEPLLVLLHSGQGPRLQVALAETLRDLGLPEAASGLCGKAMELNQPQLQVLAVEAFARAHGSEDRPLPAERSATLLAAVRAAWGGRSAWPLRRRMGEALMSLQLPHPPFWLKVAELFQDALAEKRAPGEVSQEDLSRLMALARALTQRAQGTG